MPSAFDRFPAERLCDFVDRQLLDVTQEHNLPIVFGQRLDRPREIESHSRGKPIVSLPQDLLHRLALGQFIDQFVEISKFLHEGLLDVFDPDAADDAGDQRA